MLMVLVWGLAVAGASFAGSILNTTGSLTLGSTGISFGASMNTTGVYAGLNSTAATAMPISFGGGSVANFVSFAASPTSSVTLNSVSAGIFGTAQCGVVPAAGQTCSPVGSPLNFINTGNGVAVQFTVNGTALNGSTQTSITGVYSVQFAGTTYQNLLSTLSLGGALNSTYSASFSSAVGTFELTGDTSISSAGMSFAGTRVSAASASTFLVGGSSTGAFAALIGTSGLTLDPNSMNLANFMTFAADPNLHFDLTGLDPGPFGSGSCGIVPVVAQVCTLPGSPLSFFNTMGGSTVFLTMHGTATNLSGSVPALGIYTAQFAGMTYQSVLSSVAQRIPVSADYSASFVADISATAVPEPDSWAMLAIGTLALIGRVRRNRR
jgi:hypothetical protein